MTSAVSRSPAANLLRRLLASTSYRPVSRRLVLLIGLPLLLGFLADTSTFLIMVNIHGLGVEANGLAVNLMQAGGIPLLLIAKIFSVGLAWWLISRVAAYQPRLCVIMAMCCGLILAFGAWTNMLVLTYGS